MSTRTFSAFALLLAGCGQGSAGAATADKAGDAIECALSRAATFSRACTVERIQGANGLQLVVRHPDGGFRRFDVLTGGHGLATADGAQPAVAAADDGGIDVTVGTDRYRFPAMIVSHDPK